MIGSGSLKQRTKKEMYAYLPKEESASPLNKTVMRSIWTSKLLTTALGVQNEHEAREWFRTHPEVHQHFQTMNMELHQHIQHLQEKAIRGLQDIVVKERMAGGAISAFPSAPPPPATVPDVNMVVVKEEVNRLNSQM